MKIKIKFEIQSRSKFSLNKKKNKKIKPNLLYYTENQRLPINIEFYDAVWSRLTYCGLYDSKINDTMAQVR